MAKDGEITPEGAKTVFYCEECGCGYEQCCPMGRPIGWVELPRGDE